DGLKALDDVTLSVPCGSIFAVIGPNGAGKSSLFNCISGHYRPQRGRVLLDGPDITRLPAHRIARLGVARMFQNLALFDRLSVLDNLLLGRHHRGRTSVLEHLLRLPRARREEAAHRRTVEEILGYLRLERYRHQPVGALPYGVRKHIELA